MGIPGALTKAKMGFSLPLDAPLYQPLPIFYKNVTMMLFDYKTDPQAAAALLPAGLELTDPPAVKMLFAEYGWSSLGPYNEVAQALACTYKGNPLLYAVRLHVTIDSAMAPGRELAGFPKKLGHISFIKEDTFCSYLERPAGLRICSGILQPRPQVAAPLPRPIPFVCARVIPSPEPGAPPSLAQLVQTEWVLQSGEFLVAAGNCYLTGASVFDPYHTLPIVQPLGALFFRGEMQISANAKILANL